MKGKIDVWSFLKLNLVYSVVFVYPYTINMEAPFCKLKLISLVFKLNLVYSVVFVYPYGDVQWLLGQEEVVGGPKSLYFCPHSGLKVSM